LSVDEDVFMTTGARATRTDARRNYEALLAAARSALAEHGPDAPLDDIARRAGLGIGTLYRHFPTRQSLLEAVFQDGLEAIRAEAEELLASAPPAEALARWLRSNLVRATPYRGLAAAVMVTLVDERSDLYAACAEMRAAGRALVARAQEAGGLRADVDLSDLLLLVHGIAWAGEQASQPAERIERLLTVTLQGLQGGETINEKAPRTR
jgi:AcrR family transcriptional regulator